MPINIDSITYVTKQELAAKLRLSDTDFWRMEKKGIPAGEPHYLGNRRIYTVQQAQEVAQYREAHPGHSGTIHQKAEPSTASLADVLAGSSEGS